MDHNEDVWPVFWCALLGPLVLGKIPERQRSQYLRELSQQERQLPNGQYQRVSFSTLRREWKQYQQGGVKGLYRRPRSDRGGVRKQREKLLARAVELKKEQSRRSEEPLNKLLQAEFGRTVPKSTLYRHLKVAGATRRKLGHAAEKIRCRWTRDQSNALWVGDFQHGPYVLDRGEAVRTHLSGWIDCHSRYLIEGRYYFRENLDILIDSLLRGWAHHGASRELYVDNAKIYHAQALRLACTQLNIELLHRPPRDPPAGGLIERFFRTVQEQFEAEVQAGKILTLEQLNRYFQAWLHQSYHPRDHSETGQPPEERYRQQARFVRHVNLSEILEFFHHRVERTIYEDFSDVRIENVFFAVDPRLRGDKVIVRYDPFSELQEVTLYSLSGQYLGVGRRYEREKGAHPPVTPEPPSGPIKHHYLDLLQQQHEQAQQQRAQQGIDYRTARRRSGWSLTSFAAKFAQLLGRKGGLSALSAEELEALTAVHQRHPGLTEAQLCEAFERAEPPTIPVVVFQLQNLLHERNA